jgi:hypothetical protein
MASIGYLLDEFTKLQKKIQKSISTTSGYEELESFVNEFDKTSKMFNEELPFNINYNILKQYLHPNTVFENRLTIIDLLNSIRLNIYSMLP